MIRVGRSSNLSLFLQFITCITVGKGLICWNHFFICKLSTRPTNTGSPNWSKMKGQTDNYYTTL